MKYITLRVPDDADKPPVSWKQRMVRELIAYGINVVYLAVFFAAFTWYRRLVLAEYHITYLHYWIAVVRALILAKVVMIGELFHLGGELNRRPLILPTLYKTAIFSVFVGLFALLEATVTGLLHREGSTGGLRELMSQGWDELLARCLVTFFAFIPLFAFQELGRVLGKSNVRALFFRSRVVTESGPDIPEVRIVGGAGSPPRSPVQAGEQRESNVIAPPAKPEEQSRRVG